MFSINSKTNQRSFGKKFYSNSIHQQSVHDKSHSAFSSIISYPLNTNNPWYNDLKLEDYLAVSENK